MDAIEVKNTLSANRDYVINFYNENARPHRFYTLAWFMTRILSHATLTWARRKNITEKDILSIMKNILKNNPPMCKGYKSTYQKLVAQYGEQQAKQRLLDL